jgi:hypothetical protein
LNYSSPGRVWLRTRKWLTFFYSVAVWYYRRRGERCGTDVYWAIKSATASYSTRNRQHNQNRGCHFPTNAHHVPDVFFFGSFACIVHEVQVLADFKQSQYTFKEPNSKESIQRNRFRQAFMYSRISCIGYLFFC